MMRASLQGESPHRPQKESIVEGTSLLRVPAPLAQGTVCGQSVRHAGAGDEGSGARDQGSGNGDEGSGIRGWGSAGATKLAAAYRSAEPFPHIRLTDFLDPATLRAVLHEFPTAAAATWNENKAANDPLDALAPVTTKLAAELQVPPLLAWLEVLTGFPGLVPDETRAGCGNHASTLGGFRNVHADFLAHHQVLGGGSMTPDSGVHVWRI
jgi:hypothetical protein